MTENEFILSDRIQKIQQIIGEYGEDKFRISFSGGRDSTVLSDLIDRAIPDNKIPRVYADTGIELNMIRDFVYKKKEQDERIVILKPTKPIIPMLQEKGYPFKSKQHSKWLYGYQTGRSEKKAIMNYLGIGDKKLYRSCPKKLKYQFHPEFTLRVSDKCCEELKEKPLDIWSKDNHKPYSITGIMREEGGRRARAQCLAFSGDKLKQFHPMVVLTSEWEDWYIKAFNVEICKIYEEPYCFPRTGCKGCPFALHLQEELDTLEKYFPEERRQCEIIWKPVYDEYRRIGYRLKDDNKAKGQYYFNEMGEIIEE